MTRPRFDITPFLHQDEGRHFDRKSLHQRIGRSIHTDWEEQSPDWGELGTDRGELNTNLPPEILEAIDRLGVRPRKERLREVILSICAHRPWTTPTELSRWLKIKSDHLTERHLTPLVKTGALERRFPETPTHEGQAYRRTARQTEMNPSDTQ